MKWCITYRGGCGCEFPVCNMTTAMGGNLDQQRTYWVERGGTRQNVSVRELQVGDREIQAALTAIAQIDTLAENSDPEAWLREAITWLSANT